MVRGATLVLRALAATEAQVGVGREELERKRAYQECIPQWRVYYLRICTGSYSVLSTTHTVEATHVTCISLVTTLKQ